MKLKYVKLFFILVTSIILLLPSFAFASETNGTIDSTYKYAWSENAGWINFGVSGGSVAITDTGMTGYTWSANYGWINLNPDGSGVNNNGEGILSGSAWGENTGWVDFSGVTIGSSGYFSGYASSTVTGQISFNCANASSCGSSDFKVKTDWRPQSARAACNNSLDDDGDGLIDYPSDPGCSSASDTDETDPISGGGGGWTPPPLTEPDDGFKFFIIPDITNDATVILNFEGGPDAEKIAIADNLNFSPAIYINYTTSTSWILSGKYGEKTLYVKFSNKYVRYSKVISDSVIYAPKKIFQLPPQEHFTTVVLFKRNMRFGDKGENVKTLQKFLNQLHPLANQGPGSPGNETKYFGPLTKKALIIYQQKHASKILAPIGLKRGTGFFGPSTRAFVNSFLQQPTEIPTETPSIQQLETPTQPILAVFIKTLRFGMQNDDVKELQQLLNSDPDTKLADQGSGSASNETRYFGQLTQDAVRRFQKKHDIVSFGDEKTTGYGLVGPKTRAQLKEVFERQ